MHDVLKYVLRVRRTVFSHEQHRHLVDDLIREMVTASPYLDCVSDGKLSAILFAGA